jgi:hypothetical protein
MPQPSGLWATTCVGKYDDFASRRLHTGVALVRYGDTHSRGLLKLNPSYFAPVMLPDVVKPTIRCVNNNDLRWFSEVFTLVYHIGQGIVEAYLIFAYYYYRDHRWNTSEVPSV